MRALLLAACLIIAGAATAATPGAPAPQFAVPGTQGTVDLAALRGRVVYLDFWASWCAPCKRSFPWMATLQQRFEKAGLSVVAINVDTERAAADAFLAKTPAAFTLGFDPAGAVAKLYAIRGMPSSVLIGPDGQVLAVHAGFNFDTPALLEAQIQAALSTTKTTP